MNISRDSQAIILLCSSLAIPRKGEKSEENLIPFTLPEWNVIARKLAASVLKSPEAFFRTDPEEWQEHLGLSRKEADRIAKLLSRSGQLAIELERLESLGVWVVTRADPFYPSRLKSLLKQQAPLVLFGAGEPGLLQVEGVAVAGARDVDALGAGFAARLAERCVDEGLIVISGGARGVDKIAQDSALAAGGKAVSILADSLEARLRQRQVREAVLSGCLVLLSSSHPAARFTVGAAMCRNKYIYALSRYAVVVSASLNKGGTWAGAVENLKHGWVPLFVRGGENIPEGNRRLIEKGGIPLEPELLGGEGGLRAVLESYGAEAGYAQPAETNNPSLARAKVRDSQLANERGLFDIVWPYIERELDSPKTEEELAEKLRVRRGQMQDWLKKAQELGRVQKTARPVRYVSALDPKKGGQLALFEGIKS
ncbi:MAG: DNA-protecting protein DprA [Clostridia bacterium]|nr:DNA-protecting protein DprA [Clostridia bacterium]